MKTYIRALLKCRVPAKLNENWLRPTVWAHKINHKLGRVFCEWYIGAYKWHEETNKNMLSQARLFIAYDGALGEHGHGRDTSEFLQYTMDRMAESMEFWQGRVAPRVEMAIAFDDPERFPYQYVKWSTRIFIFSVKSHIRKHYTWISFSVLLVLIQILILLIILK